MRRRQVLAAVTAALSGCIGPSDAPTTEPSDGSSPSETPKTVPDRETTDRGTPTPSTRPKRLTAIECEDGALRETFGVAANLSVPDETVTGTDTARVELSLRTLGTEERSLTYTQDHCGRNEFRTTANGFGLYLFPAEGEWTRRDGACPVVIGPNLDCGIPVVEERVTVPASDPLTWRYDVLVPPSNRERGDCLAPGRYPFVRKFTHDGTKASLSFVLRVERN